MFYVGSTGCVEECVRKIWHKGETEFVNDFFETQHFCLVEMMNDWKELPILKVKILPVIIVRSNKVHMEIRIYYS